MYLNGVDLNGRRYILRCYFVELYKTMYRALKWQKKKNENIFNLFSIFIINKLRNNRYYYLHVQFNNRFIKFSFNNFFSSLTLKNVVNIHFHANYMIIPTTFLSIKWSI